MARRWLGGGLVKGFALFPENNSTYNEASMPIFLRQWFSKNNLRAVRGISAVITLWVFVILLAYEINLIRAPFQLEYREGAMLQATGLLLQGGNPFLAQNQPMYMNAYGIVYHWVVAPLAYWLGNTFWIHRLVSGLAFFAAAATLTIVLVRKRVPVILSLMGGALIIANQLFYTNPLARPDGLGFLLFILTAFLPWDRRASRASLAVSAVLGVLAFFTKVYFGLALGYVALYLLLNRRYRAFLGYSLLAGILLAVGALVMVTKAPYYFYDILYHQAATAVRDPDFIVYQSLLFAIINIGLLFILAGALFFRIRRGRTSQANDPESGQWIDFPFLGLVCSMLVVGGVLGWSRGTFMTYYFHLITPFLVAACLMQIRRYPRLELLALAGLLVTLYANLMLLGVNLLDSRTNPANLARIPDLGVSNWTLVRERIASSRAMLDSPAIAGEILALGRPLINNGHSELFLPGSVPFRPFFLYPPVQEVIRRDQEYSQQVSAAVTAQVYDWVVVTRDKWGSLAPAPYTPLNDIEKYYRKVDQIVIQMPQAGQDWTLEFWQPLR